MLKMFKQKTTTLTTCTKKEAFQLFYKQGKLLNANIDEGSRQCQSSDSKAKLQENTHIYL